MKIGFCTDTNILKKSNGNLHKCRSILDTTRIFTDYVNALKKSGQKEKLIYFMPELVVDELISQKKRIFDDTYSHFVEKYDNNSYGLLGDCPTNNIDDVLQKEKEEYSSKYKLIKLNYTSELFETVVKEAISKKAPYDRSIEGMKTDAGFKDALIWKTILLSDDVDICDEFYFFTGDLAFDTSKDELELEFNNFHKHTKMHIVYFKCDGSQRQDCLNTMISNHNLYKTDVIELYDKDIILPYFSNISYDPNLVFYYTKDGQKCILGNILFLQFDNTDFYIDKVENEGNNYKVYCCFRTLKYTSTVDLSLTERKFVVGKVMYSLRKEKNGYSYIECNISDVDFDVDVTDLFNGITFPSINNLVTRLPELFGNTIYVNPLSNVIEPLNMIRNPLGNMAESLNMISNPLSNLKDSLDKINSPSSNIENILGQIKTPTWQLQDSFDGLNSLMNKTNNVDLIQDSIEKNNSHIE